MDGLGTANTFTVTVVTVRGELLKVLQGVHMFASQLCQAITLSYVDNMKYPFNHLIIYKGDFVWHIKCIDILTNTLEKEGYNFILFESNV